MYDDKLLRRVMCYARHNGEEKYGDELDQTKKDAVFDIFSRLFRQNRIEIFR